MNLPVSMAIGRDTSGGRYCFSLTASKKTLVDGYKAHIKGIINVFLFFFFKKRGRHVPTGVPV